MLRDRVPGDQEARPEVRDPERIERIIALLCHAWSKHPGLRLGQLVEYLLGDALFHVEDDVTERKLMALAKGTFEDAWRAK